MISYVGMIRSYTQDGIKRINAEIRKVIKLKINPNTDHIIGRIQERDVEAAELRDALNCFAERGLCEFLYLASLRTEDRPFRIFVYHNNVILQLSRKDDDWVLSTVLNAKMHNKHIDEHSGKFYGYIFLNDRKKYEN